MMGWKFWNKKSAGEEGLKPKVEKLPKPKDLPQPVGQYLIVQLKQDPDWVWELKAAVRQRPESKSAYSVRVFDKDQATLRRVEVKDYTSLDGHPDLILYEGWFDKLTNKVQLEEKGKSAPRAA